MPSSAPSPPASGPPSGLQSGLPQALAAYAIWGLLPLYLRFVHQAPAFEFVGWRIVFTMPVCLALVIAGRQGRDLRALLRQPALLGWLTLSALLIGGNWTIYVLAVHAGHVLAAAIGYYINPLLNVVLGTLFLKERLSRTQWLAVAIATTGVGVLALGALDTLWISLGLAGNFSAYGLVRKRIPVSAVTGLTVETVVLLPPAIILLGWYARQPGGISLGADLGFDLLVALAGLLTAIPLMLFAAAARRMDYATLGFIQFITPTLGFIQGLWLFHEPLAPPQAACFGLIWTACAIYCWDLVRRARGARRAT